MRSLPALILAVLLLMPGPAEGQLRFLAGGGVTSPVGPLGDATQGGSHARVGLQIGLPAIPFALRADGDYHRFAGATTSLASSTVLGGALSVMYTMPGVGLVPYLLGGVGQYRVEGGATSGASAVQQGGRHLGFGVSLGTIVIGAYAELRYVRLDDGSATYLPLTFGLRL